jgi:hypothetical protein
MVAQRIAAPRGEVGDTDRAEQSSDYICVVNSKCRGFGLLCSLSPSILQYCILFSFSLVVSGWYGSSRREKPLFDQRLQGRKEKERDKGEESRCSSSRRKERKRTPFLSFLHQRSGGGEGERVDAEMDAAAVMRLLLSVLAAVAAAAATHPADLAVLRDLRKSLTNADVLR